MGSDQRNNEAANCSKSQDWPPSLRDDCGGRAQKQAKEETQRPPWPTQVDDRYHEPNREAVEERRRQCSTFIGELQRKHGGDGHCPEAHARNETVRDVSYRNALD